MNFVTNFLHSDEFSCVVIHPSNKYRASFIIRLGYKIGKRTVGSSRKVIVRLNEAGRIQSDEILVSFDVKALFPSVPLEEALHLFNEWITTHENSYEWRKKAKLYKKLAFTCMGESYFTFRNKFYKITSGVVMDNPLSPQDFYGEPGE